MKTAFHRIGSLSLLALIAFQPQELQAQPTDNRKLTDVLAQGIQHINPEWTRPPTTLPSAFVEAADFMFDHGMADPRGGEYRKIAVTFKNSMRNEEEQVWTRGWVFTDEDTGLKYAVCWDGLVYDVDVVGTEARIEDEFKEYTRPLLPFETPQVPQVGNGYPEFTPRTLRGAALLYRLGNEFFTRKILDQPTRTSALELWLRLANPFVNRRFHRGVASFLASYDKAALRDFDDVLELSSALNRKLKSFPEAQRTDGYAPFTPPRNLKALRDDIADRIANPRQLVDDVDELYKLPRKARILQLLVRYLDSFDERYSMIFMPSPAVAANSEVVREELFTVPDDPDELYEYQQSLLAAIYAEGEESVPDLLDIAGEQKYAARHLPVPSARGGPMSRRMIVRNIPFASDIAASIANDYIRFSYSKDLATDGTGFDQWEAYWVRYRDVPIPERYLLILGESDRSDEAWIDAVERLSISKNRFDEPMQLAHSHFLTDKTTRDVFDILDRRLDAAIAESSIDFDQMAKLAIAAYRIDPYMAKHALAAPIANMVARLEAGSGYQIYGRMQIAAQQITVLRLQIGDDLAAEQYMKIVRRYSHGGTFQLERKHLPLVLFPNAPEFKQFLTEMFESYSKQCIEGKSYIYGNPDEFAPYLACEYLRPRVADLLGEAAINGKVSVVEWGVKNEPNREGLYRMTVLHHYGSSYSGSGVLVSKEDLNYIGIEQELRIKDLVAYSLSRAKIGPRFELYWEIDKRDAIIEEYKKLVMTVEFDITNLPSFRRPQWWISDKPVILRYRSVGPKSTLTAPCSLLLAPRSLLPAPCTPHLVPGKIAL